jgi:hypothetical protein
VSRRPNPKGLDFACYRIVFFFGSHLIRTSKAGRFNGINQEPDLFYNFKSLSLSACLSLLALFLGTKGIAEQQIKTKINNIIHFIKIYSRKNLAEEIVISSDFRFSLVQLRPLIGKRRLLLSPLSEGA